MHRHGLLAVLLLSAAACPPLPAQSSGTAIPRYAGPPDAADARWIRGLNYDPLDLAMAWPSAETLFVGHLDRYSQADVSGQRCRGSGLYAVPLAAGGPARPVAVGEPACRVLTSGEGFAFDTAFSTAIASVRAPINRPAPRTRMNPPGRIASSTMSCCLLRQ